MQTKNQARLYLFTFFVSVISLFISCSPGKPEDFDYGKVENNKYTNSYFDCEMSIPKGWVVQSDEQMEDLTKQGEDLIAGDNAVKKAILKASEVRTANLLGVFKYERGAAVDFNPNFIVVAENVDGLPGIKNGSDYLFHTRKLIEQSPLKYDYMDSVYKEEKINNTSFYVMSAYINGMDTDINQLYYCSIIRGFSFNVILTYNNEEQKQELMSAVNSLKFE